MDGANKTVDIAVDHQLQKMYGHIRFGAKGVWRKMLGEFNWTRRDEARSQPEQKERWKNYGNWILWFEVC